MSEAPIEALTLSEPPEGAIEKLRALLDQPVRLLASDGRAFEGSLVMVDADRNMILQGATETNRDGHQRFVGLVLLLGENLRGAWRLPPRDAPASWLDDG
jgi:small nuclear ribonucleoprotein (snRNP)-like protein